MKRLQNKNKNDLRKIRHLRIRSRLKGTAVCPRLSIFRSLNSTLVQLIDDEKRNTLCSANSVEVSGQKIEGKTGKIAVGYLVGKLLAEKAKTRKINQVIFDRGGYKYHGRVKAVADGARDGGLIF